MRFWFILLITLTGCAFPHRSGYTVDEVRSYAGRADGLIRVEIRKDREGGGGLFFLSTSDVQWMSVTHTNQDGLGGGSTVTIGPFHNATDPQTGQIIQDLGSAVGNVVGAAVKTAVKP